MDKVLWIFWMHFLKYPESNEHAMLKATEQLHTSNLQNKLRMKNSGSIASSKVCVGLKWLGLSVLLVVRIIVQPQHLVAQMGLFAPCQASPEAGYLQDF